MRIAGNRLRMRRFFFEADDAAVGIDLDDAELARRGMYADRQGADGQIGAAFDVALDQFGVVHLVDVVAGENDDVFRPFLLDGVDVLIDGVGGALVPVLVDALLRGHDLDELAQFAAEIALPAEVDVPIEAHRLVLGEDEVLSHAAIEAIREGEVDDPVSPPEWYSRFGSIAGKGVKPQPLSSRKNDGQNILHFRLLYPVFFR